MSEEFSCGYVAIVGRPNVGKSTLMNRLLGQKISITSRKPQTTRHQILGIATDDSSQTIYVDTPGLHKQQPKAINRYMNKAAISALAGIDAVVFVVDVRSWTDEDEMVMQRLRDGGVPLLLAVNKIDRLNSKQDLLPKIQFLSGKGEFDAIIPMAAVNGENVSELQNQIVGFLPEAPPVFDEDQLTDRSMRFLAAELIREKMMRQLGDELPYEAAVEIEKFTERDGLFELHALILVEKPGQKSIVIGKKGERLKKIGMAARIDMEKMFDSKIMLHLWVKVKGGWSDDERALKSLGYSDPK